MCRGLGVAHPDRLTLAYSQGRFLKRGRNSGFASATMVEAIAGHWEITMGTGPVGKGPSQPQLAKLATELAVGTVTTVLTPVAGRAAAKAVAKKVADGFDAPPPLKPESYGVNTNKSGPLHSAGGKISSAEWADPARLVT